jgi:hypothetical protein
MAAEFPLSLVIKAVDKATAPLREINKRMQAFTAPVRKLNNSVKALSDEAGVPRLMKSFKGVGSAVGNVGKEAAALGLKIAGIGAAAAVGFYAIVRSSVDAGDKLGEMAQRVGLSVDAYAQLQFAAAQADVEQEAFNSSMDKFNKNLGSMKAGGGEFIAFLDKVNPAFAQQMKATKTTEEALALLTLGFEKVTDPSKRAALAAAAFGKSGLQMGQFLGQGSKAIEEQRKRYFELHGSMVGFAAGAGELDNALRETENAFEGLRDTAMGALFPALTKISKAITGFLAKNREGLAAWAEKTGAAISAWVEGGGLERLGAGLREMAGTIGRIVERLGGLKGIATITAVVMAGPLLMSVLTLGKAIWGLGMAMAGTPIGWFLAALLAVGAAGYAITKNWDDMIEAFTTWSGWLNFMKAQIDMILSPLESLRVAGEWWGKQIGFGGATAQPSLGASAAAPGAAPGAAGSARVQVDFANVPKGVRVTADPQGTAELDLSMGYSMVGP